MARGRKDVSDVIRGRHVWSLKFRHGGKGSLFGEATELITTAKKDYLAAASRSMRFFKRHRSIKSPSIQSITYCGELRA
jgi:hypothetical protein